MIGWRRYRRRRALVNLKSGKAFEGILWDSPRGLLVLRNAELIRSSEDRAALDGDIVLERTDIDFVQIVPAAP